MSKVHEQSQGMTVFTKIQQKLKSEGSDTMTEPENQNGENYFGILDDLNDQSFALLIDLMALIKANYNLYERKEYKEY